MIRFERTHDWELVREIVTSPAIYPHISDDFSPKPEDWKPVDHESVWYVLVRDDDEVLGLWVFSPENGICWKVHTCLLPNAYGFRAGQASRLMARWIWDNTPCRRIVTDVPIFNRLAYRFAKRAGMTEYGLNPRAYMKNGRLHHVILLGMSKE